MPRFAVVHTTNYSYETLVTRSYGQLCMLPRQLDTQNCLSTSIELSPAPNDLRERTDFFGNRVSYFVVDVPHSELVITARSEVEVVSQPDPTGYVYQPSLAESRSALKALSGDTAIEAAQYLTSSPRIQLDQQVREYAKPSFHDDRSTIESLLDLTTRINREFHFKAGVTTVTSTVDDLFAHGAGVCQDFAHLAVAVIRSQGLPARYMSGYLETDPPPGRDKVFGADVSHAWVAAYVPMIGWISIDPTNDQFVNERYITTGWGRDYSDVSPLKGVIFSDGGKTKLDVSVDVSRID